MNAQQRTLAQNCLDGAENGTRSFPEIVGALALGGFDGYLIDYRRATAAYFLPSGDSIELPTHKLENPVGEAFDASALKDAILEAQNNAPGYSYKGFCSKAKSAGCAGYLVSIIGRRVLYFGRTGETHVEHFPSAPTE